MNTHPLYYCENNAQGKDYWFAVEIKTASGDQTGEAQIGWMTYRALMEEVTGVFFYNFIRANSTTKQAMKNVCKRISDGSVTTVLDGNAPLTSGVTFTSGGSSVVYTYYSYSTHHWLFVVDKTPGSGSYPKNFTVECEVSSTEYDEFELVYEGFYSSEVTGAAKEAPSSIKFSDSIDSAGQGKFYHIVSI